MTVLVFSVAPSIVLVYLCCQGTEHCIPAPHSYNLSHCLQNSKVCSTCTTLRMTILLRTSPFKPHPARGRITCRAANRIWEGAKFLSNSLCSTDRNVYETIPTMAVSIPSSCSSLPHCLYGTQERYYRCNGVSLDGAQLKLYSWSLSSQ